MAIRFLMNEVLEFKWSYYRAFYSHQNSSREQMNNISQTTLNLKRTKENMWHVCSAGPYLHLKSEALDDQLFAMASVIMV